MIRTPGVDLARIIDSIDIDGVVTKVDLDAVVARIDVNEIAKGVDIEAIVAWAAGADRHRRNRKVALPRGA